jgi:crotonobetainyl-CoA:carnitine CoA-transferase CaiB-like acyl-CoA transferase
MSAFFKDLKVIELANVLAGPAVGMFFAELGAEVIKVENKLTNGDVTRSWKLDSENKEVPVSAYYASVNWNKKSLFLDLSDPSDQQQVLGIIKNADILICNYKSGDDKKLGMDPDSIRKINPEIIYAHLTGFGEKSNRTAYDLVLQAETGFMSMNGTPESGPVKMPVAFIDLFAAHQLKEAILLAYIHKLKTGKGATVHVSLFDSAIASLANQASNWLMAGHNPGRIGSLHPNIAPYGELFTTADNKQIVLAVGNNKEFERLCEIMNKKELVSSPEFSSNTERVKNRQKLFLILNDLIKNKNSEELMSLFIRNMIPAGIIYSVKEVFENNKADHLILTSEENGFISRRVKSIAFSIQNN